MLNSGKKKEIDHVEMKKEVIGLVILTGVYQSKNENILQLWSKEDGYPSFNKIMSCQCFEKISVLMIQVQEELEIR